LPIQANDLVRHGRAVTRLVNATAIFVGDAVTWCVLSRSRPEYFPRRNLAKLANEFATSAINVEISAAA
jgi:hypothetical protein